ncbi:hypothetical protein RchiOBHm_Chr7g0227821 [Rosa chinensis]|uniref:Uncharacterized protein n=1 Tax=Rosa chinensis TaxID=74649 RepID=A0A2P6PEQ1_ROSCH|nr:hypothetical protein RchiOBHm_Chr7g0227821 [Rosa chinensis]
MFGKDQGTEARLVSLVLAIDWVSRVWYILFGFTSSLLRVIFAT